MTAIYSTTDGRELPTGSGCDRRLDAMRTCMRANVDVTFGLCLYDIFGAEYCVKHTHMLIRRDFGAVGFFCADSVMLGRM